MLSYGIHFQEKAPIIAVTTALDHRHINSSGHRLWLRALAAHCSHRAAVSVTSDVSIQDTMKVLLTTTLSRRAISLSTTIRTVESQL